jgi:Serine dehydrogenase proteinase
MVDGDFECDLEKAKSVARDIASRDGCDIFLYNGTIERGSDLRFMYCLHPNKRYDTCRIILITDGGDPDAAYKVSRYLQEKFACVQLLICGKCKSAGTLIAIGATELIFSPYGEMGPLDVQVPRKDKASGTSSALNISEGFMRLEQRALDTYTRTLRRVLQDSKLANALADREMDISFEMAESAASRLVQTLYGPIFGRIDLDEVGSRLRTLKIAADYGRRLDKRFENMQPGAIDRLTIEYASHSFVIDEDGAKELFRRVRRVDDKEYELIGTLGDLARWQNPDDEPVMMSLSAKSETYEAHESVSFDFSRVQNLIKPDLIKPNGGSRNVIRKSASALAESKRITAEPELAPPASLRSVATSAAKRSKLSGRRRWRRDAQRKPTGKPKRK